MSTEIKLPADDLHFIFCKTCCGTIKALHCRYDMQMECCECRSFLQECYEKMLEKTLDK